MNSSVAPSSFPPPVIAKNDRRAKGLIWVVSIIIFLVIASLSRIRLDVDLGFDPHVFALVNAIVNTGVSILLIAALVAVKNKKFYLHKKLMVSAILLSLVFLASYIAHHLLAGDTRYGDINHDGILDPNEKNIAGNLRYLYYALLLTHIPLAAVILPFILFTAYRSLSGNYAAHVKLARITWPVWLYVAVSGVAIFLMIRKYY